MGHEIINFTIDGKKTFREVCDICDEYAREHGEYHTSLPTPLRWVRQGYVFENCDKAKEYFDEIDDYNYNQYCARYLEYPDVNSLKLTQLNERLKEANKKYWDLEHKPHYKDVKSTFISCPHCGSKINTKVNNDHFNQNRCPVCYKDVRPQSTLDTLKRYQSNIDKLKEEIKIETQKLQEKAKNKAVENWVVKIEYHV